MPLANGTLLGPYRIQNPLGKGGMGEVYRAEDTRLGRAVAIKVLSASLSQDGQFRERFAREARAISSLSHPNLCALYDVGSQDGVDFIVMEYLEGETLAGRMKKGPLAVEQVLRYGTEVAMALEAAHRRGIIHRDLKPGNIMLTKTGAKLLDFGLARLRQPASFAGGAKAQEQRLTASGMVIGTLHYMAPEQIEGREADARTDIFALGCVLYETMAGRPPFTGGSTLSVMKAVLEAEPPPSKSCVRMRRWHSGGSLRRVWPRIPTNAGRPHMTSPSNFAVLLRQDRERNRHRWLSRRREGSGGPGCLPLPPCLWCLDSAGP